MYGRGNYTAPLGQGPYTNTPPFHQRPSAPPPPPLISQGPHPPPPSMIQQGLPPIPSQVGHLGHTVYPHTSPGLPQQGPPNSVLSSTANNQPYLNPARPPHPPQPLQVHGTSQMQQHSHWTPNASLIPPTALPSAPRVLPPPPSQGQTLFSNQVQQPAAGSRQAPPQPHPQASRFYASSPVGSSEHLMPLSSNAPAGLPPPPPPPLPSSLPGSPPLPPSSSPPSSSSHLSKNHMATHISAASESTFHPDVSSSVSKSSGHEMLASASVGGVSFASLVSNDVCGGDIGSNILSAHGENFSSDLPPAPPKPADGRIVRSIELLCQFIAKNGPEFENMTRLKECENPGFKFLFGGEPGSEAAIAYDYFVWTKRKYHLEFRSVGKLGIRNSPITQTEGFSSQQGMTTDGGVPSSPTDSDMDMEDDITHPLEEPQSFSSERESHETVSSSSGLDKERELRPSPSIAEPSIAKDAVDKHLSYSQHSESGVREQRQGSAMSSHQDESIIVKSFTEVDALDTHSSGDVGLPITVNKTVAPHEGLSQPSTSAKQAKIGLEKVPNLLGEQGASPFRLLPDYASDESSRDEDGCVDVEPKTYAPPVEVGSISLHTDEEVDLGTELGTERVLDSDKGLEQRHQSSKSHSYAKSESVMAVAHKASITRKSDDLVDNSYGNQESLKDDIPQRKPPQIVLSRDDSVRPVCNVEKNEDPKNASSMLKVDEFGRLIREDDSDSDPVGSPRYSRRKRDRSRSRSRSRSPYDRRRRRSPRRRTERRGRSRSFSPKRHRSRSKSPLSRHGGDTMRRDKRPECFDFVKGKCYRGTSCRYLHHEEKSDRSRSYRSRQQFQNLSHSSRTFDVNERFEMPYKKSSREINEARNNERKPVNDLPITEEKKGIKEVMDGATSPFFEKSGDLEPSARLMTDPNVEKAPGDAAHKRQSAIENSELQQSQIHFSDRFFQNTDHQLQQIDTYPDPESAHLDTPSSITNQLPTDKTQANDEAVSQSCTNSCSVSKTFESESISAQSMVPKESVPPVTDHLSKLPLSFPSVSQVTSSSFNQEMPKDSDLMSSAAKFPSTGPVENFPPYQASVSYPHDQFSFPPNPSWNFLPPPPAQPHPPRPAFVNDTFLTPAPHIGPAVHLTQNMLPPRNDFHSQTSVRPYISQFPHPSSVGQNQGFPSSQEPNGPPGPLDDWQPRIIAASQPIMSKSHGGPGLAGEDHFSGRPGPGIYPSSSSGQESLLSKSMPFSEDSISKRPSFPGENLPPAGGVSALHDESSSLPLYVSNFDRRQPSVLSNYGISRISNHFNPYASTFEQPLSSKFSANLLVQEMDKPLSRSPLGSALSQVPGEGRAVAILGSLQPGEAFLPQPGSNQYDPLFDSIEPSLNSVRKSHHGQKHEITDESDDLLRFSGSNKPLEGEENKRKVGGASEASGSLENDEYGETADAEVGDVENGSPSNRIDATDNGAGEVEIDQVNSPGKSKKRKESRSMKLFKVAIANFVKEVLKPSWRQGNMSKEAFKTIVKKTVDRVSGAMKSHQIPKSQAKINHYIDSSQRKLTKLVMGYVDKYVKV